MVYRTALGFAPVYCLVRSLGRLLWIVAYTDQPETRFNNTTVLIQHSKWWSFSLSICSLPNKETQNMDIHYLDLLVAPSVERNFRRVDPWTILRIWRCKGGNSFRNFWVGMCRWDHETLGLYQSLLNRSLLPNTGENSPNAPPLKPYRRVAVFQKVMRSLRQSTQSKPLYHHRLSLKKGFIYTCFSFQFLTPYLGRLSGKSNATHARTH